MLSPSDKGRQLIDAPGVGAGRLSKVTAALLGEVTPNPFRGRHPVNLGRIPVELIVTGIIYAVVGTLSM